MRLLVFVLVLGVIVTTVGCALTRQAPLSDGAFVALQFSELVHGYCTQKPVTQSALLYDFHLYLNRYSYPHGVRVVVECR